VSEQLENSKWMSLLLENRTTTSFLLKQSKLHITMKNIYKTILMATAIVIFLQQNSQAQAFRTWISGVGDDANPCSRTAPCKTWAGAISKTAAQGEINALDPAGFGAVTITKSITLSGIGVEAGILVSTTNGISINAAATDLIILKGLDIEGMGSWSGGSLSGVNILSAKNVLIEDCIINGFIANGFGFGVNVAAAVNPVNVIVHNSRITKCNAAINIEPTGAVVADVNLIGTLIGFNEVGINSTGIGATVRLSNSSIFNNTMGVSNSTGKVISFGNNNIAGNTTDGVITVLSQQ
jgi:hypothetical protein